MTDGVVLSPGAGERIRGAGMTLKVGDTQSRVWSVFEAEVTPGFDVGAHLHHHDEELFYILEGELDLLAFEPTVRSKDGWQTWTSSSGAKVVRGGAGSCTFVPPGCPHAFSNPGEVTARMVFLFSPPGHEHYLAEVGKLTGGAGPPDPTVIADLRARYDIHQLTPLIPGRTTR